MRALRGLGYAELATRVMRPFVAGSVAEGDFAALVADAYRGFSHPAVAPLRDRLRGGRASRPSSPRPGP